MRVIIVYAIIFLYLFQPQAGIASQCPSPKNRITDFGLNVKISKTLEKSGKIYTIQPLPQMEETRYVRFLIKPVTSHDNWGLVLRDDKLRQLQIVDKTDFRSGLSWVWTERLYTKVLHAEIVVESGSPEIKIEIPTATVVAKKSKHPYYSTKGSAPDWVDLHSSVALSGKPALFRLADSVGMMTSFSGSSFEGGTAWCCTGSIIAVKPRILFLTNHHCGGPQYFKEKDLWSDEVCQNTIVDLSWDKDNISREFWCKRVVGLNVELDVAVLELVSEDKKHGNNTPILINGAKPRVGEPLKIIHHPQCLQKKLSRSCVNSGIRGGWKGTPANSEFSHTCDTAGGSSGSPIFNSSGHLVGLHHQGYENTASGSCDKKNKAIAGDHLAKYLKGFEGISFLNQ